MPQEDGFFLLAPVDYGSQVLFRAELVPGSRPRVRVLPALASTEILADLPGGGVRAGDPFRPTPRFARGEWSALETDEEALRANKGVRVFVLE